MDINLGRFRNRVTHKFDLEVVTPLFLGGAERPGAELRTASIKGMLRFWWRALYGHSYQSPEELQNAENRIWGGAVLDRKEDGMLVEKRQKSQVKISFNQLHDGIEKFERLPRGHLFSVKHFQLGIIDYLAYGLHEYDKTIKGPKYIRAHIPSGVSFSLLIESDLSAEKECLSSLATWLKYGGLGSRARNGLGSLTVKSWEYMDEGARAAEDYFLKYLPELNKYSDKNKKDYCAFSSSTCLYISPEREKWEDALSDIGKAYRDARLKLEDKHKFIRRPLLAKPLEVKKEISIKERYAKPCYLNVQKENGKFRGQILVMPDIYGESKLMKQREDVLNEVNDHFTSVLKKVTP